MTHDQLGHIPSGQDFGWGLGFALQGVKAPPQELGTAGEYNWGGFFYTAFSIDPKEDMIVIFMARQRRCPTLRPLCLAPGWDPRAAAAPTRTVRLHLTLQPFVKPQELRKAMKKMLAAIFAFAMLCSVGAIAQDQAGNESAKQEVKQDKKAAKAEKKEAKAENKEANAAAKNKAMSLTGWVKTEGDKTVFVNDKDKQTWNIANADVARPHDGQHVKVKANLNEADKTITIDKLKELRKGKQSKEAKEAKEAPKS